MFSWWFADLAAVCAHSFGFGYVHAAAPTIALVLPPVLEALFCDVGVPPLGEWSIVTAVVAAVIGAAAAEAAPRDRKSVV